MQAITNESGFDPASHKLAVIKFWAPWCQPCKRMSPILDKLEQEFEDVKFFSADMEKAHNIGSKYQIRSIPTVIMLKNGQEVGRFDGVTLTAPLRKALNDMVKLEE